MKFDLKKPCDDCPFLRRGGIRLRRARAADIGGMMLDSQGGTFACHKTTDAGGSEGPVQHCAGALIFAEKNETATQAMRIAERLQMYDYKALRDQDLVFDTLEEMLEEQD